MCLPGCSARTYLATSHQQPRTAIEVDGWQGAWNLAAIRLQALKSSSCDIISRVSTETDPNTTNPTQLLDQLLNTASPRARSLLVTVFGDSVTVHGGSIWLASLVRLAQPFGLNERLVRTAVFRLTREQWLQARSLGRRRYYELTDRGVHSFESADRRIYDPPSKDWDGCWRMVLASHEHLRPAQRQQLRRELLWRGYAAVSAGLYVHPTDALDAVREFCAKLELREPVVVLKAQADSDDSARLQDKFARAAKLEQLCEHYRTLHARLAGFRQHIGELNDEQAFVLRTLTIHEYRRVLLRDPCLPAALLPRHWPGDEVRQLCAQLYRALLDGSERFLQQHAEHQQGAFSLLPAALKQRFRNT